MRGNAQVRLGGRPAETNRIEDRHRAPGPPNQVKVRDRGRVLSKALVIAYGVHESGRGEVVGLDLGEIENEASWIRFLRGPRSRGLTGLGLVVSGHHEGRKSAIAGVLGAPWQQAAPAGALGWRLGAGAGERAVSPGASAG